MPENIFGDDFLHDCPTLIFLPLSNRGYEYTAKAWMVKSQWIKSVNVAPLIKNCLFLF